MKLWSEFAITHPGCPNGVRWLGGPVIVAVVGAPKVAKQQQLRKHNSSSLVSSSFCEFTDNVNIISELQNFPHKLHALAH